MTVVFYVSALVALLASILTITRTNAIHALLYFIVSLFATAIVFFLLGAPFAAALEVIIYAGAIMVLFVFVVMLLNFGEEAEQREHALLRPGIWVGPSLLGLVLAIELVVLLISHETTASGATAVGPDEVARTLFGPYVLGVEIVAMLLLAGLIGAYHVARRDSNGSER